MSSVPSDLGASSPPRRVDLWSNDLDARAAPNGANYVRHKAPLGPYPDKLTQRLAHWADVAPDRIHLAARDRRGEWRKLTYAQTFDAARRLGQALLGFDLSAEHPLLILSENGMEHALLALAALHVGVTYAPVSPAYSLVSTDFGRLRDIVNLLRPGLVFAADGARFGPAIEAVIPRDTPIVVTENPIPGRLAILFDDLMGIEPAGAVDDAHARVGPDTIAKFLFTSGSTGSPKGVINTQRMLCSNQEMVRACFSFLRDEPPIILDWAPWNHTAAGNKIFGMALYNGGTFYIDEGKPTPAGIKATARNLRDVTPTWYFNVPKGYEELVPYLEGDTLVRENFFSRLKLMMYAGAGMAQHTWDALQRLSIQTTGERILLATGLGATETSPFALMCTTEQKFAGNCGVPAPGLELKLAPIDGKFEARLRGPSITPGYWRDPEATAKAFDEEGFYRLGDALRFADPADASKGFYFDGRIAENFKLRTGTWVNVGALRAAFINHFGALVRDVVLTGLDLDYIGALIFPDVDACRELAAGGASMTVEEVLAHPCVRAAFGALLTSFARESGGSSTLVRKVVLLTDPPSVASGEITDKGSINQRAALRNRAAIVAGLYDGSAADVISI